LVGTKAVVNPLTEDPPASDRDQRCEADCREQQGRWFVSSAIGFGPIFVHDDLSALPSEVLAF